MSDTARDFCLLCENDDRDSVFGEVEILMGAGAVVFPKGSWLMDILRLNEGRIELFGFGMTTSGRLAW